jgi:ABC-type sugar transport system permease subunit
LFCLPAVGLLALFVGYPLCRLVYYSLTNYDGLSAPTWFGFGNYRFLIGWPNFHRVLFNNAILVLGVVVWVLIPFIVSVVIFPLRRANAIRAILFIPALLPPIIVGGVFRLLLADDGILNQVLHDLGLGYLALPWLSSPKVVLFTIIGVIAWATLGTGVLLYSTGLSAMSPSYVEAARLDGASWVKMLWYIYRPALRGITRFWALLLTATTVTGFFPWIYGLTQGGPGSSSTTLDYDVYLSLSSDELGRASAIAVVSILFVVTVILVQRGLMRLGSGREWAD